MTIQWSGIEIDSARRTAIRKDANAIEHEDCMRFSMLLFGISALSAMLKESSYELALIPRRNCVSEILFSTENPPWVATTFFSTSVRSFSITWWLQATIVTDVKRARIIPQTKIATGTSMAPLDSIRSPEGNRDEIRGMA